MEVEQSLCVVCRQPLASCEGHEGQVHDEGGGGQEGVPLPSLISAEAQAEHAALFESNKQRLAGLAARGFGFSMQAELMDEVLTALFGAPGTQVRDEWALQWERKVAARLGEAEATAAQLEAQRAMQQLARGNGRLPGGGVAL